MSTKVHQIFMRCSQIAMPLNSFKSELQYYTPFWNAKATNEGE